MEGVIASGELRGVGGQGVPSRGQGGAHEGQGWLGHEACRCHAYSTPPASKRFATEHNDLIIGNFGDGRINAFRPVVTVHGTTVRYRCDGQLVGTSRKPIKIVGLWGLRFGNGGQGGPPTPCSSPPAPTTRRMRSSAP